MQWKPTPWIAALLGLLATPLGMLYVQRPRLALGYFALSIVMGLVAWMSLWGFAPDGGVSVALGLMGWVVSITCAVHAFRIARNSEPTDRHAWYSRWYGLIAIPLSILVATFLVRSFLYEPFRIPSQSMHPTLLEGSIVLVSKAGYGHYGTYGIEPFRRRPTVASSRGDIVVHRLVADPKTSYVSRVVAVPGDHIRYSNRHLILNGRPVPTTLGNADDLYQYAVERIDEREVTIAWMPARPSRDFEQIVPPGQLVVFGDSRDNARDSRFIGLVPQENVVGHVVKIFRPHSAGNMAKAD